MNILLREKSLCETDTERIAIQLWRLLKTNDKVCVQGEMGVGKSFIVRCLLSLAGVRSVMPSPTFTLIHPYVAKQNWLTAMWFFVRYKKRYRLKNWQAQLRFYHIDLYRLQNAAELKHLDLASVFTEEALTFVEWGEQFELELKHRFTKQLRIVLTKKDSSTPERLITLEDFT